MKSLLYGIVRFVFEVGMGNDKVLRPVFNIWPLSLIE